MRIVAIGDVGVVDDMIHLGDEAMFEQFVVELRQRGIDDIVGISANPDDTAVRYGIDSIGRIGFGFTGADARKRMLARQSAVLAAARGESTALEPRDSALAVIDAIRRSDGVAIAGGGNLASNWPLHIFERATIGALATLFGKPLVVTGQTIGPELSDRDAPLVAELLSSARLVGLRESASLALVTSLGVPPARLTHTVDDASFLGLSAVPSTMAAGTTATGPSAVPGTTATCVVSLSTHLGGAPRPEFVARMAELLDSIAVTTGVEIVFLAHFGSIRADLSRGDSVLHDAVAAAMTTTSTTVIPTTARDGAELARAAALVVTSRYHPAVFAVPAGVPTIGIPVDEYTSVKLTGALGNFGQSAILPVGELLSGAGAGLVEATWSARDDIRASGRALSEHRMLESGAWWDAVAAALRD